MKKIFLASASPRRRELLAQLGLTFEVLPGNAEENPVNSEPSALVKELSRLKAADIFKSLTKEKQRESLVIGADTIVSCDNRIMGKPKDEEDAVRMLSLLQGRTHQVYTGVTLFWQENEVSELSFFEKTDVTMFPMTEEEIRKYVNTGEPMDKAGAYGIQGRCAAFVKGISGDYNNVVGLPIGRLYQEMKKQTLL